MRETNWHGLSDSRGPHPLGRPTRSRRVPLELNARRHGQFLAGRLVESTVVGPDQSAEFSWRGKSSFNRSRGSEKLTQATTQEVIVHAGETNGM